MSMYQDTNPSGGDEAADSLRKINQLLHDGITTTIPAGDLEIGAVELKDAGTDTRANVLAANTARTTATVVLATQHIGADGKVGGADGADATQGTTTDAPVADNTTVTSATAATGVGLWKRIVNLGIAILAKLPTVGTAGTASANVITVQGIASGTTLPVTATLASASRTPSCTAAVASASTSAGVKSVTFLASSDFSGTVLGQAFAAGASLTFNAPAGDTLGTMVFTRAAGTLFIYYVT